MLKYTTIAGKEYPISFGTAAMVAFEADTGISVSDIATGTAYTNTLRLLYAGLRDGARRTKTDFALDFDSFCDLLDEDPSALQRLQDAFEDSMPKPAEGEKKAKAARKG